MNWSNRVFFKTIACLVAGIFLFLNTPDSCYAVNMAPKVGAIIPYRGSSNINTVQYFTTTFSDANGCGNISQVKFLINTSTSMVNCFYGYYDCVNRRLYLYNDAGTSLIGGYAPLSANTIENSYVKLDCSKTRVSGAGSILAIKWSVTFKAPFAGAKNAYLYAKDKSSASTGWVKKGTWTINAPPQAGSIDPAEGASSPGEAVTFTTTYLDPNGWQDVKSAYFAVNTSEAASNCFYAYYNRTANKLYMMDDAGSGWIGGYAPGSTDTMENSCARLNCSKVTISGSGNTMTIKWPVTFKAAFAGAKKSYLRVVDNADTSSGWEQKGSWNINAAMPENPPIITASIVSSAKGPASNNMLGASIVSAVNLTGNGLKSVIVGAPGRDSGTEPASVYVYVGSDLAKNPDLALTGSSGTGCFGYSISSGDINNDGYGDLIIGEPANNESGAKAGKVYVYFGGVSVSGAPDVTIYGQAAGDMFGYSTSCGDVNNDGSDDIIIGAPYNSGTGKNAGKAYVYFGGQTINPAADITMSGEAPGDLFGTSLAAIKDIAKNDGGGVAVGAPRNSGNGSFAGKVYIYLGGNGADGTADMAMMGEKAGDMFGGSVSSGDFNGDGRGDVIAGAALNSDVAAAAGKAYIYFGGKTMADTPGVTLAGELADDWFGHVVACAGDINGDGFDDIVVTGQNDTTGIGKAYIYFGGLFMDKTAGVTIENEFVEDNFGSSVSSAGDIDADGIDELVIGASCNGLNGINAGKAYLYKISCSNPPVRTPDALLDETEAMACKYFYDQILTGPGAYGLVKDTCYADYSGTAATGFGLTSLCIMASRYGTSPYWTVTPAQAAARASAALDTLVSIQNNQAGQEEYYGKEGFFFRFIGPDGKRAADVISEVSTSDTALLLAGVITAGKYFGGDIQTKADRIFAAVNWNYFLDTNNEQFYLGWNPDYGIIQKTWDRPGDETLIINILAIASDTQNKNFLKSYYGFPRVKNSYAGNGQSFSVYNSYSGSLSTYILAHCWYDFKKSGHDIPQQVPGAKFPVSVDWWENSKAAAQANRQFCIDNVEIYSSYGRESWGLSACFRPEGSYFGMNGAPPREYVPPEGGEPANDGTVPAYGAISALPFMKDIEIDGLASNLAYQALAHYHNDYYFRLWGPYGPRDSFNQLNEFSTIYSGIDLGPIALMIENYRSGLVWNTFMSDPKLLQANSILFRDTVPPVVSQFTVLDQSSPTPGYTHSATVSVSMDGYDVVGITKWLITETPAQPVASDFSSGGSDAKPAVYTITAAGNGLKQLYVWAIDDSNNVSSLSVDSQAQIYLDSTPPSMGEVAADGPQTTRINRLHASWSAQDPESGVIEYLYRITEGASDGPAIRGWTSTGTATEVTAEGLPLVKGRVYYFSVKARNGSGLWSSVAPSIGITLIQSAPSITGIAPGDGSMSEIGSIISLNINAADPEGDAIQYKILADGQALREWDSAASFDWDTVSQISGSRKVTFYAKDVWGNESSDGADIYLSRETPDIPQVL